MDGCFAMRFLGKANGTDITTWLRGCCLASLEDPTLGSCAEIHRDVVKEEINNMVFTGHVDLSWSAKFFACFSLMTSSPGATQTTATPWILFHLQPLQPLQPPDPQRAAAQEP